jgi:hypothetical protein
MNITGTVRYEDIEGGCYKLQAGKQSYVLKGQNFAHFKGRTVQVEGDIENGVSMFMAGPVLIVKSIKPISG